MLEKIVDYRPDAFHTFLDCAKQISFNVGLLNDQNKEIFYASVKKIVRRIKQNVQAEA